MTDEPSALDYEATLKRMEPGISPVDIEITTASIAISLKKLAKEFILLNHKMDELRHAISGIGTTAGVAPAVNGVSGMLGSMNNSLMNIRQELENGNKKI